MDISEWLRGLDLEQYAQAFRDNGIDMRVLPKVTAEDLKDLGITMVGHRRLLLEAIAALGEATVPSAKAGAEAPDAAPRRDGEVASTAEAERRQVTVMFCDLVGSTVLSAQLDPEDLREVLGSYQRRVAEIICQFEGFVAKYMGDGVLAYFGYPHAHEDDAEQAVRASRALIDAVRELQAPHPLQVRVGIATGLVVVGDLIGTGSAQEQGIVGETPNLAARLQALAEPDAVVIAEGTRRQIGTRFEVCDLGPQTLKGFAEPQRAWRVLGENRALGRFEALRSGATPLLGRDEELELLLRRWTQAKAGSGRVVLISGEPGLGKSRLAEALEEKIAGEPHIRLRYFCSPHHENSAFHPIIVQIEHAAGFAHDHTDGEKLAKLQTVLGVTSPPIEDVALIAELHSLPSADLAPPLALTPQRKKEKTFEALLRQVEGLSRQQPVLMVFEDFHWLDASSRELVDRMIERVASWPVLLVATFRPEFQPPWMGQPHVAMLTLTRLGRHDTAAMVENIAGSATLSADVVQEIAERTDGVPLFVEELTKAVLESGEQTALSAVPHPALSVPATLHASLMARLDRLGLTAKNVAQTGAAIGREFGYDLLASVADLPEPELHEALDRLTQAGLLFARGTPPNASYIFKHALVQDTAHGTLLRGRRHELHGRIAVTLEERFQETAERQPESLAYHFTEAGLSERAVVWWLKAGQQALARSATTEAAALLAKGLSLVCSLPDGPQRQGCELDLQIGLGQALIATKGYTSPAVGHAFARAHELCDYLERPHKLLPVLYGQWAHHSFNDLTQSLRLAEEIRQLGEARDDHVARLMACRANGCSHLYRGEFAAARASLEHGLVLDDPAQRTAHASIYALTDTLTFLWSYLSLALVCCGHFDQSPSLSEAALAHARRLSHAHSLAFALSWAWVKGWCTRSPPRTLLPFTDELLTLADERDFVTWRALGLAFRGWCLSALGQPEQGVPLIIGGLSDVQTNVRLLAPLVLTLLGAAHRMAGQPQVALGYITEAVRSAETTSAKWLQSETLRLLGDLLVLTGDAIAAKASFHEAIALARYQGAKLFELRSATSLARLWRDQGKVADAHALLAPIYDWFTEGFDAPDLAEAKALLDELGGP